MKRHLLFSMTWIAVISVLLIMTFTLGVAATPPGTSSSNSSNAMSDSKATLESKVKELLQQELDRTVYLPFNSPTNPWLHPRKEKTSTKRFVKQTWTSIDGKRYRPLNAGAQRYLFNKNTAASK